MLHRKYSFDLAPLFFALMIAGAGPAKAGPEASLCHDGEKIQFSCSTGRKTVSLCASFSGARMESLIYRYGLSDRIELEYVANHGNGRRFQGTISPASPKAWVGQVWFDRGNTRYMMSSCTGGDCPYGAGLSVLNLDSNRILMNARCSGPSVEKAGFSRELVRFGSDVGDSASMTDLLELGDYGHPVEQLYPRTPGGSR